MTLDERNAVVDEPGGAEGTGAAEGGGGLGGQNEVALFHKLQERLACPFGPDGAGPGQGPPGVVVIVPSFTLDQAGMDKIPGILHYEERLLSFLQLLAEPGRRIVYLTSRPMPQRVVDYALGLVRSVPARDARARLTLLDCGDDRPVPLTWKVLQQPGLVERVRDLVPDPLDACLLAFNGSVYERRLAVRLGVPLYACDPDLAGLGGKSGARALFKEAGVPVPPGIEGVRDGDDLARALAELRAEHPGVRRAMIKLNESFGAGGNAMFDYRGAPQGRALAGWLRRTLPQRVEFATPPDTWENYAGKLAEMGGVVEEFLQGEEVVSPSAQVHITPAGAVHVISTQDQRFEGAARQTYAGCSFPARAGYRLGLQELAGRAGRALAGRGVIGIASIDFVTVRQGDALRHHAVEINLRMGGGTAPLMFLHGVTGGRYEPGTGGFVTPEGEPRCYVASDRVHSPVYRSLTAEGVLDAAARQGLLYRHDEGRGAVFHMLGALPGFGKLGVIAIDTTPQGAEACFRRVVDFLDMLAAKS
ncbi:peptide ligase PGM1-related protein [Streptomyces sp. enrichment culture]|uniref:peptide ligase PGM1-related protein n=1 Tax=Streptomyces sp. enrichment culture TaxID=1795815 RepID=UPI003F556E58